MSNHGHGGKPGPTALASDTSARERAGAIPVPMLARLLSPEFRPFLIFIVALGLGLTMVIGEFDLSVSGVFGLGGCVAVLYGNESIWLGIACALGVGIAFGMAQGFIVTRFGIGSVPVTLGGLLTANGLAYVV